MKGYTAATVSSLLAGAARAASAGGVVQWDIQKRERTDHATEGLGKRASTYQELIANDQTLGGYFAACEIGTPPQKLTLQLDTGSSDVWVPSSSTPVCKDKSQGGCPLGSFNPSQSSTFNDFGPGLFDIKYVDDTESKGDYFRDVFQIGSAKLSNMTMGLGKQTTIPYGLVGVGYTSNEAITGGSSSSSASLQYPNLPVNMVNEGLINTVAYSLWLNDLDASTGSILFGGIDTDKYHGNLTSINIYPTNGIYVSFTVALTSLHAISSSGSDSLTSSQFPIPAVLDSGTTLSYLPTDLAEQVWTEVGAVYSSKYETAVIPCRMQKSSGYFSFGFAGASGPRINVSMDELVLDLTTGKAFVFASGPSKDEAVCQFGIQNFTNGPYLLGDTFLRSAYVVYDLVNNQVALAPTDFNATSSNIVPFPDFRAAIPFATPAPNQNQLGDGGTSTTPDFAANSGFASGTQSSAVPTAHFSVAAVVMLCVLCGYSVLFLV